MSRKKVPRMVTALSSLLIWCAAVHAVPATESAEIDELMSTMYQRGQFNGAMLVSTVDDLFKWDQALYTDRLVDQSTLAEAFVAGKVRQGTSTYSFGWNIEEDGGSNYLWHQGSDAGFRAFVGRRLADRVTVIMLTNKGNSKRQDINAAIHNILADKPYVLPKQSGAEKLYRTIPESGIQAALQQYNALKKAKSDDFDLGESESFAKAFAERSASFRKAAENAWRAAQNGDAPPTRQDSLLTRMAILEKYRSVFLRPSTRPLIWTSLRARPR
jgi:hypothetical protein